MYLSKLGLYENSELHLTCQNSMQVAVPKVNNVIIFCARQRSILSFANLGLSDSWLVTRVLEKNPKVAVRNRESTLKIDQIRLFATKTTKTFHVVPDLDKFGKNKIQNKQTSKDQSWNLISEVGK